MGLDMYLDRETYIGIAEYRNRRNLQVTIEVPGVDPDRVTRVVEEAAYWRKANQIHGWFVENVQGGVDECQRSYVSRNQLQELLDLCKEVLAHRDAVEAGEKLPPRSGCFFGGYDISEWYWEDLESTVRQLGAILARPDAEDRADYYYQASW